MPSAAGRKGKKPAHTAGVPAIRTYKGNGQIQHRDAVSRFRNGRVIPAVVTQDRAHTMDGWQNVLAGFGSHRDKQVRTHFNGAWIILDIELQQMYLSDGLVTRIVDVVADDMTREWIDLEGDPMEASETAKTEMDDVAQVLEDLDAEVAFNMALKWTRLYGGALIVMGVIDGQTPDQPLDLNRIRGMSSLRVVDRVDVQIWNSIFDTDVTSPTFGQPLVYDVIFHVGTTRVEQFVHASRCIPIFGKRVPQNTAYMMNAEHRYWGLSELQFVYDKLRDFGSITSSVVNIVMEFLIGKFTLNGLGDMMAEGNEKAALTRMEIIAMCKSVINAVLLDAGSGQGDGEKFERDAATLTGLPDIMDRFMMIISGVTGIPVTRLFGRSAAGMDATGDNDVRDYFDRVRSEQKTMLKPALRRLLDVIAAWKKIGQPPTVKFNSLQQMTDKEQADISVLEATAAKTKAETDALYITNLVLTPEDVYQRDFADDIDPIREALAGDHEEEEGEDDLSGADLEQPQPPVATKTAPGNVSVRQPMPPSMIPLQEKPTPAVTTEEGGGPA
jgi:phage-related protein (TIGR01555 family)